VTVHQADLLDDGQSVQWAAGTGLAGPYLAYTSDRKAMEHASGSFVRAGPFSAIYMADIR
jgi:hypothetical protein